MTAKPDLFWGLIASMWIGNLMLVLLNLPLVGLWVTFGVPSRLLFPAIMAFSAIGIYSSTRARSRSISPLSSACSASCG